MRLAPMAEVGCMIDRGDIRSAVSIAALYKALRLRERLLEWGERVPAAR